MASLILAVDEKGGIAKNGKIPWSIPDELMFFKRMTMGGVVIMGRKTFESIGKELPGRTNIVVGKGYSSVDDALTLVKKPPPDLVNVKKWVIGGSYLADTLRSCITEIFLTVVNGDYDCDLLAPQYVLYMLGGIIKEFSPSSSREVTTTPLISPAVRIYATHSQYTVYQCFVGCQNLEEEAFRNLIYDITINGAFHGDRTGVGTQSVFGRQLKFSLLNNTFPLMTIRKAFFRGIFEEMMWFLRGETDSTILSEKGIEVWRDNSRRAVLDKLNLQHLVEGDCGPIYGHQWRHWGAKYIDCKTDYTGKGIDQIAKITTDLRTNPFSRRMVLSGWNVEDLQEMCLPPCHTFYQFEVSTNTNGEKFLNCHMYQRSSDIILAGHWNISGASLLTILLAKTTGLLPGELTVSYGNVHIYNNHRHAIHSHFVRSPHKYPKLEVLVKKDNVWDYTFTDLKLSDYIYYPPMNKLEMNA